MDLQQAANAVVERVFPYDAPFKNDLSAAIHALVQRVVERACGIADAEKRIAQGMYAREKNHYNSGAINTAERIVAALRQELGGA